MAAVKIEWTQRTAGREIGDQEEVELTPFVEACLEQGRVFIVQNPIVGFSDEAEAPVIDEVVQNDEPTDDIPTEAG